MNPIITQHDIDCEHARVELYRWQHGGLPDGQEKPLDEAEGLRHIAKAIMDGSEKMNPYNVALVLKYAAHKIDSLQALLVNQQQDYDRHISRQCDWSCHYCAQEADRVANLRCPTCNVKLELMDDRDRDGNKTQPDFFACPKCGHNQSA